MRQRSTESNPGTSTQLRFSGPTPIEFERPGVDYEAVSRYSELANAHGFFEMRIGSYDQENLRSPRVRRRSPSAQRFADPAADISARLRASRRPTGPRSKSGDTRPLGASTRSSAGALVGGVLENQMADCRVRRGDVIEAMHFFDVLVERAAHDEPHHEFHCFRAGIADVLEV